MTFRYNAFCSHPLLNFPSHFSLISLKIPPSTSFSDFKNPPAPMLAAHVLMGVGPSLEAGQSTSADQWELLSLPTFYSLWTGASAETPNWSECRDGSDCGVLHSIPPLTPRLRKDLRRGSDSLVWEERRTLSSGQDGGTALLVYSSGSDGSVLVWLGGGTSQGPWLLGEGEPLRLFLYDSDNSFCVIILVLAVRKWMSGLFQQWGVLASERISLWRWSDPVLQFGAELLRISDVDSSQIFLNLEINLLYHSLSPFHSPIPVPSEQEGIFQKPWVPDCRNFIFLSWNLVPITSLPSTRQKSLHSN